MSDPEIVLLRKERNTSDFKVTKQHRSAVDEGLHTKISSTVVSNLMLYILILAAMKPLTYGS